MEKNYRLVGVGDELRLGKGGPLLKKASSTVTEILSPAGSSYAILKVATPSGSQDLVRKDWLVASVAIGSFNNIDIRTSNTSGIDAFTLPDATSDLVGSTYVVTKLSPNQINRVLRIAPMSGQKILINNEVIEGTGIVNPSELVTNGAFTSNITGWTQGPTSTTSASWSAGTLAAVAGAGYFEFYQDVAGLTIGKTYIVRGDIVAKTGSRPAGLRLRNTSDTLLQNGQNWNLGSSLTTYRDVMVFVASATTMRIGLAMDRNSAGQALTFDNITMTEMPRGYIEVKNPHYGFYLTVMDVGVWSITSRSESKKENYTLVGRDSWTSKTSNPTARSDLSGFSLNGYGYATCGSTGSVSDVHSQYNDETDAWTAKAVNPTARSEVAAGVSVNGYGYITGGFSGSILDAHSQYNDSANTWAAKAVLPTAKQNATVWGLNGYYYCAYGNTGSHSLTNHMYNDSANSWTAKTSAPVATSELSSFVLNGFSYSTGGTGASNDTSAHTQYNDFSNAWISKTAITLARRIYGGYSLNGFGFCPCGLTDNGATKTAQNDRYNDSLNSWLINTPAPTAKTSYTTFALNGYSYVSCGDDGSIVGTTHQYN